MNSSLTRNRGSGGTSTAALYAGGEPPTGTDTETWNGSAWTEVNEMNTGAQGGKYCGTTTAGLYSGGARPGASAKTEFWDGTSWTEVADLAATRNQHATAGTSSQAIVAFGNLPSVTATAEVWTTASGFNKLNLGQVYYNSTSDAFKVTEKSVPSGVWSSGGTMNTSREQGADFGSLTAGVAAGGGG